MKFEQLYNFVKNPKPFIYKTIREILRENQTDVILLNIQNQLYQKGEDSKGKDLGTYRPLTIANKKAKGAKYDHVTLLDEGDFYDGIVVRIYQDYFELAALDDKTDELEDRYGDDIVGLSAESITLLINNIIKPNFEIKLKKHIYGN